MKFKRNVFNTSLTAALLSCTVLGASFAQAAESQSYSIDLTATIPTDAFQVIPVDSGWINQTQEMVYDITTEKLQPFEKQFQYKNTSGGIQATLTNTNSDGKTILSNGAETIPLSVKFNGVELSNTATTVVAKDPAKAGGRTALRITPASDKKLDVAGSFTGNVAMVFEPTLDEQNPPESK